MQVVSSKWFLKIKILLQENSFLTKSDTYYIIKVMEMISIVLFQGYLFDSTIDINFSIS